MGQRLKRWESPRKPGRNAKGRGGSARQRQRRKQQQQLRQKLKDAGQAQESNSNPSPGGRSLSRFYLAFEFPPQGGFHRGIAFLHQSFTKSAVDRDRI
jgi:hypothetical protein